MTVVAVEGVDILLCVGRPETGWSVDVKCLRTLTGQYIQGPGPRFERPVGTDGTRDSGSVSLCLARGCLVSRVSQADAAGSVEAKTESALAERAWSIRAGDWSARSRSADCVAAAIGEQQPG